MTIKRLVSLATFSVFAALGGCATAPEEPKKAVGAVANSHVLAACAMTGLRPVMKEQFRMVVDRAVADSYTPQQSARMLEIVTDGLSGLEKVTYACAGKVAGVAADKMPAYRSPEFQKFFDYYFDQDAFAEGQKAELPAFQTDMINEASKVMKDKFPQPR